MEKKFFCRSLWSFHPVLPRLILIPTVLFLLMALSVFWVFCMSLAFIPACTAYRAFSRPSPTSPALFTGAATVLAALTAAPPKDTVRPLFLYSCSSFPLQVLSLLSMSTFLPVMRVSFPAMMSEALTVMLFWAWMVTFPFTLPKISN